MTVASEIQKLSPSAILDLYVVDATSLGGSLFRFHSGTNGLNQNVVWQGETYVRYPVLITGFEYTGQGQFPRPKLQVANILSAITQVLLQYDDLLGAKVIRKRTLAKFLDAVNFESGTNPDADPTAEFDEDIYYIDRKASEDRDYVEFELASAADLAGVQLPRRKVIQNVCVWKYRGAECGYTGPPVVDLNDAQITRAAASSPEAITLISTLEAYEAAVAALAAANIVLSSAALSQAEQCEYRLVEARGNTVDYLTNGIYQNDLGTTYRWDSGDVTLGLTYRRGTLLQTGTESDTGYNFAIYQIEKWAINSAACSSATSAYSSALSDRDAKAAAVTTALAAYNAAFSALPNNDSLYGVDRCGKRLASCKARFGATNELPFGSFPAAGLSR